MFAASTLVGTSALLATTAPAASAAITPAAGVHFKAAHSNKCINVSGNSLVNNAPIIQYTCGDSYVNDKFRVRTVGTAGNFQIIATSSNRCLNVKGAVVANQSPVVQYGCVDTAANNLWRFVPVAGKPTFRIVGVQSNKCLNVSKASVANNAPLIIYTCTTSAAPTNDQFYFPPAAAPVATPLATVEWTPVAGVQAEPAAGAVVGPLVYAFTDNRGLMWRAYQPDPDVFSTVEYSAIPGLEQFAGHPQINVQADGRAVTAARNAAEGDLWLTTQTAVGAKTFTAAQDVGGAGVQQPAIGKLPDGKLITFAVVNGAMWQLPQDGTTTPYGAWRLIGGANLVGEPAVVTIRDGLRLFALDTSGAVQTATYRDGVLSDWAGLGTERFTGRIGATVLPGYRTRVVVRNAAGLIFTKGENVDGTFEADWTQLGDFAAAGSPAAVMDPATGATVIVARGADGQVYWLSEAAQAGVWGPWSLAFERVVETDPTIVRYTRSGGPVWGYAVRDGNNVPYLYTLERRTTARMSAAAVFAEHALPAPPK